MKPLRFGLIVLISLILFANRIEAQNNIHILDAFYQALAQDSSDEIVFDLQGGDFVLDDYPFQNISPQEIIERHPDASKYLINDSIFHIKGLFKISGNIKKYGESEDPGMAIKNIHFDHFEPNLIVVNLTSPNEIFYFSYLRFENVKVFKSITTSGRGNMRFQVFDSEINDFTLAVIFPPYIEIRNSKFGNLIIALVETDRVIIDNCTINRLNIEDVKASNLIISNNVLDSPLSNDYKVLNDSSTYLRDAVLGNEPFRIISEANIINRFELINNHFKTTVQNPELFIRVKGSDAYIMDNTFDTGVRMSNRSSSQFKLTNNKFSTLSFSASLPSTPQNFVKIDWQDLKGKLVWKRNRNSPAYFGENDLELANISEFNSLISSYGKLVEVFKNNRNTADANAAYLELKNFESNQYRYIYKTEGGSDNLFRLKLHQLLSIYTEHGTNPAQAISASVWLIFLFGAVYFFFPSDWDEKSKPQLISDFKTLVQKNEHGYFFPFLKLAKGFLISLFNAFILSINSFVTLGFGRIPTHGVAKYICILEGFLGWFLLSIFIVSLINQVLF